MAIIFFAIGFREGYRFRKLKEKNDKDKTEGELGTDAFGNKI